MYAERAADDQMCIYCLGVNKYFSFLFFLYFCYLSPYKCGIKAMLGPYPTHTKFEKLENFHMLVRYG